MKSTYIVHAFITLAAAGLLLSGCKYDTSIPHPEDFVQLYMPQAVTNPVKYKFRLSDTAQVIIYGANYGGTGYPERSITVSFTADTSLTAGYNLENGTHYVTPPGGSFTLQQTSAVIRKGTLSTDPLELTIKTEGYLQPAVSYLLPVRLSTARGDTTISHGLDVTYFVISAVD